MAAPAPHDAPLRAIEPDAYEDFLFALTEYLTDIPAAFDVGISDGVLIAVAGWFDEHHQAYCARVTCWHYVN